MASVNTEISASEVEAKITELRTQFLEKHSDVPDERDLARVREDDGWLKQFLHARKHNVDNAMTMMETALKWRKEFELNDITEESISNEILERGSMYFHSCDKDNHDIMYIRVKDNKKDPELMKQVKRYFAYMLEQQHTQKRGESIVVLMDFLDMGMSNVDLDLLKFQITCYTTYFPLILEYILIYEMPWIANAIWKIVKTWLSAEQQKRVLFCKKSDIQEYINKDKLWIHMGGTDGFVYKYIPRSQLTNGMDTELESSTSATDLEPLPRSSSWSGSGEFAQQNSARKKVTFNESSIVHQSSTPTAPRGLAKALLQSSCLGEIGFPQSAAGSESRYILTLTNTRTKPVAFKVKTTTPAGYRVRPGSDTVQPGTSNVVEIVCLPAHQQKCTKDRFLLMAAEVDGADFDMRNVAPENLYTQRYNVTYGKSTSQEGSSKLTSKLTTGTPTPLNSPNQADKLSQKIDQLLDQQKTTSEELVKLRNKVSYLCYVLCCLLFMVTSYIYFYGSSQGGDTCHNNPAKKYSVKLET